ncbi:MAG: exonuclease [Gammaproteobacteria bacterium]|nr:exonuclease [Gammaproteobacteria bacterium]
MLGWTPEGAPFRRLLNHNAEIPPEASRVNGYTREILEHYGEPPLQVYDGFARYVGELPLVAYNLRYDLDDVLRPEWQRLGIEPIGHPGFCALRLTQRLLDPVPAGNHKLHTLRQYYRLPERGAHTASGDVETVVDLMQQILRPLAAARGLETWDAISAFIAAPWFPSRIAFGKYKGRPFRDALDDPDLYGWLQWLASVSTPHSAEMGRWYLDQLSASAQAVAAHPMMLGTGPSASSELVLFHDPELETLRLLIADNLSRLADLEVEYIQEHHSVEVVQSQLFSFIRPHYERRDGLQLKIQYRRKYLDTLMIEGVEEAETVIPEYEDTRAETEREYQEAAAHAAESRALSDLEQREIKTIFRKLVGLYHPDRFAHQSEKQEIYKRLRQIPNDPDGFLLRRGMSSLDFDDHTELATLRQLYVTLQERILNLLDELEQLRVSGDYELLAISRKHPDSLQEIANQQAAQIAAEIAELEADASQLAEEIASLTGTEDPFGD